MEYAIYLVALCAIVGLWIFCLEYIKEKFRIRAEKRLGFKLIYLDEFAAQNNGISIGDWHMRIAQGFFPDKSVWSPENYQRALKESQKFRLILMAIALPLISAFGAIFFLLWWGPESLGLSGESR